VTASRAVTICNRRGLHARAAAKFVAAARAYSSEISLSKESESVRATSIMDLLMLAAGKGTQVTITADGEDEQKAVEELAALIDCGFEETD
jgi:phosphocarrier protein